MLQVVHIHQGGLLDREVLITDGHPMDDTDLLLGVDIAMVLNKPHLTLSNKVTIHGTAYRTGDARSRSRWIHQGNVLQQGRQETGQS